MISCHGVVYRIYLTMLFSLICSLGAYYVPICHEYYNIFYTFLSRFAHTFRHTIQSLSIPM